MTAPLLSPELVGILRCPQSRQALRLATADELTRLNGIASPLSTPPPAPFEAALVTVDGAVAYPVRNGFPILLIDEAIRF